MIYDYVNYRSYLKDLLSKRIEKNTSYSLRSLAKTLEINPSFLSQILRGHRSLSADRAYRIADRLGLKTEEVEYFCLLVQYESVKDSEASKGIERQIRTLRSRRPINEFDPKVFDLISDWYYLPVLQMSTLRNVDFTTEQIAEKLGITELEAEDAVQKLLRSGLLVKTELGGFEKASPQMKSQSTASNLSFKKFHSKMIEKAERSLYTDPTSTRINESYTVSAHPDQLPFIRKSVQDYIAHLMNELGDITRAEELYQLSFHFFPLTRPKIESSKIKDSENDLSTSP